MSCGFLLFCGRGEVSKVSEYEKQIFKHKGFIISPLMDKAGDVSEDKVDAREQLRCELEQKSAGDFQSFVVF